MTVTQHEEAADIARVLPNEPYATLADYLQAGGGAGLQAACAVPADTVVEELVASGLRGRGGAGFPTGVKWRTIKSYASPLLRTSVVVNAAEGEPGTFKDRAIIMANPYAVIEGALIAARVVEATSIVIATKARFADQVARLRSAIAEVVDAGWAGAVEIEVVEGPTEYLFGDETALLEVIDGRPPFPRIAPPYRRGVVEVVDSLGDLDSGSGLAANIHMAGTDATSAAPPVLVNNAETMANVPAIVARGTDWFRSVGTAESPGTIVCTVTGAVQQPGVAEVAMGTSLREAIERAGGGVRAGSAVKAVLVGVSGAVLAADQLDTLLTYESMSALGSGLGSAGFIVIGDDESAVSVAAGVSRFLAVESCGQCTPCKVDGLLISGKLAAIALGDGVAGDLEIVQTLLQTVADGARCSLATQHQSVVGSLLTAFAAEFDEQMQPGSVATEVTLIAELVSIDGSSAVVDTSFVDKQPDWTYEPTDSGKTPVDRFSDHRTQSTESDLPR